MSDSSIVLQGNRRWNKFIVMIALGILSSPVWALHYALEELDKAQSGQDWENSRKQVEQIDPSSDADLRSYIKDRSKDGRKRVIALRGLCRHLSPDACDDELINAFHEDNEMMFHASVAMEMGRSKGDRTFTILKQCVNDPREQPFAQVAASQSLSARGDPAGKDRALQAILNAEPWADFGMVTLENLRATDVLPRLEQKYMSSTNYHIKNDCRLAVLRIRIAGASEIEQVRLLKEALSEDGYFEVRQWAGIRLGHLGGDAARTVLVDVMRNHAAVGRQSAYKGLLMGIESGHWTETEVQQWLAQ